MRIARTVTILLAAMTVLLGAPATAASAATTGPALVRNVPVARGVLAVVGVPPKTTANLTVYVALPSACFSAPKVNIAAVNARTVRVSAAATYRPAVCATSVRTVAVTVAVPTTTRSVVDASGRAVPVQNLVTIS